LRNDNHPRPRNKRRRGDERKALPTGWPVGFWWSELSHPYFLFSERGYEIEVFSPNGGPCEADAMSDPRDPSGYSASDLVSMGFIATPALTSLVQQTKGVDELGSDAFDAIVVVGGQAPMFTFDRATNLQRKFVEFYEAGKVSCVLCHGVALLRYTKLSNGKFLVAGKTVTGFANVDEDFADNAVWSMNLLSRDRHVMPWRIEDELKKIGANYVRAGLWRGFCRPRRQSRDRPTELLRARDRTEGHRSAGRVMSGPRRHPADTPPAESIDRYCAAWNAHDGGHGCADSWRGL
jgi:putative intracellular protease/amidase